MQNSPEVRYTAPVLEVLRRVESVPSVRLIVGRVLRPFTDNFGHTSETLLECGMRAVNRKAGDVISGDELAKWSERYRQHLAEKGLVKFEALLECPTCHRTL
jgi:hypothetical protein